MKKSLSSKERDFFMQARRRFIPAASEVCAAHTLFPQALIRSISLDESVTVISEQRIPVTGM